MYTCVSARVRLERVGIVLGMSLLCVRFRLSRFFFPVSPIIVCRAVDCRRVCVRVRVRMRACLSVKSPPMFVARLRPVSTCDDDVRFGTHRHVEDATSKISTSVVTPGPGDVRWVYDLLSFCLHSFYILTGSASGWQVDGAPGIIVDRDYRNCSFALETYLTFEKSL